MNFRTELLRQAGKLASAQTARRVELTIEIARLESKSSQHGAADQISILKADAENCEKALHRFAAYRPEQQAIADCPYCWIVNGESNKLQPKKGASDAVQLHRCDQCTAEYEEVKG